MIKSFKKLVLIGLNVFSITSKRFKSRLKSTKRNDFTLASNQSNHYVYQITHIFFPNSHPGLQPLALNIQKHTKLYNFL